MKEIPLTQGYVALIDDADFESVADYSWSAKLHRRRDGSVRNVYAQRVFRANGTQHSQKLHRFILGISDPSIEIDHRNGNGLDCQRHNMRPCSGALNRFNARKHVDNASGFKGVSWKSDKGKWRAEIQKFGKGEFLGYFSSAESAAAAYNEAAVRLFGEFALLNDLHPELGD